MTRDQLHNALAVLASAHYNVQPPLPRTPLPWKRLRPAPHPPMDQMQPLTPSERCFYL